MNDIVIFLSTAFNVCHISNIPVSQGKERVCQYKSGLKRFFELDCLKNHNIIISDNTVSDIEQIDKEIIDVIPLDMVSFNIKEDNYYGSQNKGAGIIKSWLRSSNEIKSSKYVLHFEPRMLLKSFDFIENFLYNPGNCFTLGENRRHFNTGLFGVESEKLLNLCNSVDLDKMVDKKVSLEYVIYNYFSENKFDFLLLPKMDVVWFDSYKNIKIEM